MADFCAQCSVDIFGEDMRDMAALSKAADTSDGRFAVVRCEDCGPCQVDHEGRCVSVNCLKKHGAKP